jgi:hypothetical protein
MSRICEKIEIILSRVSRPRVHSANLALTREVIRNFPLRPRINPFRSLAADNNDEYYHCHSGRFKRIILSLMKDSHDLTLNGIKLKAGYPEHGRVFPDA